MAYTTPAEVRLALVPTPDGSLPTDATFTAADLSDAQLNDAITEADAMIDSYIGGFYAVPVTPVAPSTDIPQPIGQWARTIAVYYATLTYRGSQDFTDQDPIARRYKDTLLALQMVAKGTMRLQLPQNTGPNASAGAGAPFNPYVGDLWTPDDFSVQPDPLPGHGLGRWGRWYDW